MRRIHIGLDFGTKQSKVCVNDVDKDTFEFYKFNNGTFFLPTKITETNEGKFIYGDSNYENPKNEFFYFKIASANDEDFSVHSSTTESINKYNFNDYNNYTPEFLSLLYITYIQYLVKDNYLNKKGNKNKLPSILTKSKNETAENILFSTQVGIPTEWSQEKNIKRKRKFETILLISHFIQENYSKSIFLNLKSSQLIEIVKKIYSTLNINNQENFDEKLNSFGLSVYPETAASLSIIINTDQIKKGKYYSVMDIGGGSTDVSFFYLENNGQIKYLASESYLVASNDVYLRLNNGILNSKDLRIVEDEALDILRISNEKVPISLFKCLKSVNEDLKALIKVLFNKRVYMFKKNMKDEYKDQDIIMVGGGSKLPVIKDGNYVIHDSGSLSLNVRVTSVNKREISKFSNKIHITSQKDLWEKDFSILCVSLGLALLKHSSSSDWFSEEFYNIYDYDTPELVSHPFNEGYFIYDVLQSKWR